jgi:hypothetical protein
MAGLPGLQESSNSAYVHNEAAELCGLQGSSSSAYAHNEATSIHGQQERESSNADYANYEATGTNNAYPNVAYANNEAISIFGQHDRESSNDDYANNDASESREMIVMSNSQCIEESNSTYDNQSNDRTLGNMPI